MPKYSITAGSIHEQYMNCRTKVQIFGGGFANGKTAASCVRALQLAKDYPGSNGLIARSTYPKLNDTIRKEFLKWCPAEWIKSFPQSANASNTCVLTNGSMINFRYIQQQGKSTGESTTSNLLSATYDWIVVDQMEDPEISYKDFLDLLGRLRGNTPYVGDDPTMPPTGPRFFMITTNPTRNWLYKNLVLPLKRYEAHGLVADNLLCERDEFGKPVRNENGKVKLLISLFEGSTYENKHNLAADFLQAQESIYTGVMRDRFLLGKWAAYEGLVYPNFDEGIHTVPARDMDTYFDKLIADGVRPVILEGYDHGIAAPACYLFAFADHYGNIHIKNGFKEKELTVDDMVKKIWDIRNQEMPHKRKYGVDFRNEPYADPAIFRRTSGNSATVGTSVSGMFFEATPSIMMMRGNNDINSGVMKVLSYLQIKAKHRNPYTGDSPAPHLFVSDALTWWVEEIVDYYWRQSPDGTKEDIPMDRNDHAMDTTKYLLTSRPMAVKIPENAEAATPSWLRWYASEANEVANKKGYRYAST